MNRRKAREACFIILFQYAFQPNVDEILEYFFEITENVGEQKSYIQLLCERFIENTEKVDELIEKHSKNWRIDRISMVSLAALRLSVCEMLYCDDVPNVVSLAEALEITKKFEGEDAVSFVNGILEGIRVELEDEK